MSFQGRKKRRPEPVNLVQGRVSDLVPQRKNPSRISVFVDDTFAFGVHRDVLNDAGIAVNMVLPVTKQEALLQADEVSRAWQSALRMLGSAMHTENQLRKKLAIRSFSHFSIDTVVQKLSDLKYLDDTAYARVRAESLYRLKSYGPHRIRMILRSAGITDVTAGRVLEETFPDNDRVLETVRKLADKKLATLYREQDPARRRKKIFDFLRRRGFDTHIIQNVLNELLRERE